MPKKARERSAIEVQRLSKRRGKWAVGGVDGLYLVVTKPGVASWSLVFSFEGRRPERGLGPFPEFGLAQARSAAKAAREQIRAGVNPIDAARAAKSAAAASRAASKTFSECAAAFIKAKAPEWANAKHAAQWSSTLATYADPIIGNLLVQDVDTPHILAILEPIWLKKTETATRVRSRLENVLDWAIAREYRRAPNPARWKGHLSLMLASPGKVAKVAHHPALAAAAMPAFMNDLRNMDGAGARALEFAILTAARSGEVRGAEWSEFDFDAAVWTVPAERMKMKREHRVPLSRAALQLLRLQRQEVETPLVFPNASGGPLSDMTLTAVTRRMKVDAVPHGFRSTFRTWAGESTSFPREVLEMALAHAIDNKVEEAYARGDLFRKRVALMQAWADFCGRAPSFAAVTPIRNGRMAR